MVVGGGVCAGGGRVLLLGCVWGEGGGLALAVMRGNCCWKGYERI
jgi:hypothetical protein